MIATNVFLDAIQKAGIEFISGVPDSLLKHICAGITNSYSSHNHIIATNEGSAVGLAIGHYLATSKPALVYMQNSGLGNVINPILSLADPEVYSIPMVLLIGWRGEIKDDNSQLTDEPQHKKQGKVTLPLLESIGIPYKILDGETDNVAILFEEIVKDSIQRSGPVALVVRKNTFSPFNLKSSDLDKEAYPTREETIEAIIESLPANTPIVSTTGKASRELFELRKLKLSGHQRDFLTVGGMGHASQIAAGIAIALPLKKVVCIDGDGAGLMHMGALANSSQLHNFIHIMINNGAHESVGGQPTKGNMLNLSDVALTLGYGSTVRVSDIGEFQKVMEEALKSKDSFFIEVMCKLGSRENLGRPSRTPIQNKSDFMSFIGEINDK
jgi:phosphonopyruvate decarboxylase